MSKVFFGGVPTKPEVDKLMKELAPFERGQLLLYEQVEAVINIRRDKNRFYTVTMAFRKRLLNEFNILTKAIPNTGFKLLTESERQRVDEQKQKAGLRGFGRAHRDMTQIQTELLDNDADRLRLAAMQTESNKMIGAAQTFYQNVQRIAGKAPAQLPRFAGKTAD
jgi:hypothetical protein